MRTEIKLVQPKDVKVGQHINVHPTSKTREVYCEVQDIIERKYNMTEWIILVTCIGNKLKLHSYKKHRGSYVEVYQFQKINSKN